MKARLMTGALLGVLLSSYSPTDVFAEIYRDCHTFRLFVEGDAVRFSAQCRVGRGNFVNGEWSGKRKESNGLDLNQYIGNDNGRLMPGRDFMKTCKDMTLPLKDGGGLVLQARCKTIAKEQDCSFFGLICSDTDRDAYATTTFQLDGHLEWSTYDDTLRWR